MVSSKRVGEWVNEVPVDGNTWPCVGAIFIFPPFH